MKHTKNTAFHAKLTDAEFIELCERRRLGDEYAQQVLFFQVWLLMHFFAGQFGRAELSYSFYERIDALLDKFDPLKGNLSTYVKRAMKWHMKNADRRKYQEVVSMDDEDAQFSQEQSETYEDADEYDDYDDWLRGILWKCMVRLDEHDAQLVKDRYLVGMGLDALAKKHKYRSHQCAHYACSRAMNRLKKEMRVELLGKDDEAYYKIRTT